MDKIIKFFVALILGVIAIYLVLVLVSALIFASLN